MFSLTVKRVLQFLTAVGLILLLVGMSSLISPSSRTNVNSVEAAPDLQSGSGAALEIQNLPLAAPSVVPAPAPGGAPYCGDGVCQGGPAACSTCPEDCGVCPVSSVGGGVGVCGDGICTGIGYCPQDCGVRPTPTLDSDGGFCGDGVVSGAETCRNCPADAGVCP